LKAKDTISDKYRKQVDELLDNQSDNNFFRPLDQKELDEIWEEISTDLDIGEVWNEISSNLDIVMPVYTNHGVFVKSFAALLIILIGMVPVKKFFLDSPINQLDISVESRTEEQSAEVIINKKSGDTKTGKQAIMTIDITPELKRSLNKAEYINNPNPVKRNRIGLTEESEEPANDKVVFQVLSDSEKTVSNTDTPANNFSMGKPHILTAVLPEDELKRIKVYNKTDFDKLKTSNISSAPGNSFPSIERGKISAGLVTLFKNTWLLNHETFDGLKSESLNSSEIVFYPDVGLTLNYSLNKNWLIQADGFLFSNTGQEYLEYLYGHYARKKITLRYSTIALSVKHKFTSSENLVPRSSINVLAGGYFSILNYASQKINTDLENIQSQYKKFDFGVRLAGEFELQIFNQLSLAPGISLSLGLPNIYKGSNSIPANLIRTHNGSADFQFTLYYHFK
jgi:hypothetical protein